MNKATKILTGILFIVLCVLLTQIIHVFSSYLGIFSIFVIILVIVWLFVGGASFLIQAFEEDFS